MPFFLDPMVWLFAAALLLALATYWRRRPRIGPWVLVVMMVALGSPALGNVWLSALERQQPLRACLASGANVTLVLGGGVDLRYPGLSAAERLSHESWRRALAAVQLVDSGSVLLLSGGGRASGEHRITEAAAMAALLSAHLPDGVTVLQEASSRNTFENAQLSAQLLRDAGLELDINLVTSAVHMPRARRVFEAAGFELCAHAVAPVAQPLVPWTAWLPQTSAYLKTYIAVRELIALGAYWALDRF